MNESSQFEKMVALIHTLFEKQRAIITWNDKVYGDADPKRERQVDVTVKRDDALLHIECRKHKNPQDVTWIEQLIGRKETLHPDILIAVSSSGFTKGAKQTAIKYGIILRDLLDLTEKEISTWGNKAKVMIGYLRYEMMSLIFCFDPQDEKSMDIHYLSDYIKNEPLLGQLLTEFKRSMEKTNLEIDKFYKYCLEFNANNMTISRWHIKRIFLIANIKYFHIISNIYQVQVFGNVENEKSDREIFIQKMDQAVIEIGRLGENYYSILDLSSITPPENSQFRDIVLDMGKPSRITGLQIIGRKVPNISLNNFKINTVFKDPEIIVNDILQQMPGYKLV